MALVGILGESFKRKMEGVAITVFERGETRFPKPVISAKNRRNRRNIPDSSMISGVFVRKISPAFGDFWRDLPAF
jgi:hypothetical protein